MKKIYKSIMLLIMAMVCCFSFLVPKDNLKTSYATYNFGVLIPIDFKMTATSECLQDLSFIGGFNSTKYYHANEELYDIEIIKLAEIENKLFVYTREPIRIGSVSNNNLVTIFNANDFDSSYNTSSTPNYISSINISKTIGNIDLNIRALADKIIVVTEINVKTDSYGLIKNITWQTKEFNSADVAEKYCTNSDLKDMKDIGKNVKYETKHSIFKYYDSHANKPVFYYGRENQSFDYYTEYGYVMTAESFNCYNNNHYYVAPQGYWKNADYDKKILKKYGENYGD